tara:strand:- start:27988 stop:29040 length:1053 start_codon:yes stop_codon:yes gene_type:complete
MMKIDTSLKVPEDIAWDAFERRDRAQDGRFVVAVRTTGIYCKPSCPARRPRRENVEFFADPDTARRAGYRPCLRCKPDEQGRDRAAVAQALAMLEEADERVSLDTLAEAVGYAPHHFQRLFTRDVGVSPAAYARGVRARRAQAALEAGARVTDAIYDAGYSGPSRFYAETKGRLGMTPGAWKKGGQGERIRFAVADSILGPMLVAGTDKGLCRISFDEGEAELRARFPQADILPPDPAFEALVTQLVALVDDPVRAAADLPVDVRGTAFQQAVWQALRAIPPGETRSYAEIAAAVGRPKAVRAVGTACGDNSLAVLIPCHRVLRGDGGLGGYAYGLERKRALLKREKART